ncbi:putative F-box protein At3g10430 isoform X1 [Silene latifolia]|uniref:putative F-box protein At3g10430 isoform X1 n=1 Tax=Silene latifolia TaxID=37657 RepID=UPI003D78AA4A
MALSLHRYTNRLPNPNYPLFQLLKHRTRVEREKSMLIYIAPENGNRLPENVLIEILTWLPVKEVLQYKSVCKSWYSILSSPQFISKHLKNNRHRYIDNCLLALFPVTSAESNLCELLIDETPRVLEDKVLYGIPEYGAYICGPCDGLYYLCAYSYRALWNPSINEVRTLPPIIITHQSPTLPIYAFWDWYNFGVDPVTGDYKVVVIYDYIDDNEVRYPLSVFVYSLRTDSWKYCGDLAHRYDLVNNKCYFLVNGCCFWLSNNFDSPELIISFDMTSDSFQELPIPNYQRPASNCLGMYEESIAFFSVHEGDGILFIWTLNHGMWTKKFTIGSIPDNCIPIGHWNYNKVFLQQFEGRRLVLCDPNTLEIKDLGYNGPGRCMGLFCYMESLLSIKDNMNKCREDEQEQVETDITQV